MLSGMPAFRKNYFTCNRARSVVASPVMSRKKALPVRAELKPLFFRPPAALRTRFNVYVAGRDLKKVDVLAEAVDEYLKKRGA